MNSSDKSEVWAIGIVCFLILMVAGEPDLLDAISDRVSGRAACMVIK